jgi:hypothetical protein
MNTDELIQFLARTGYSIKEVRESSASLSRHEYERPYCNRTLASIKQLLSSEGK